MNLEIVLTPAELQVRATASLSGTTCVVFDILRATSTMVTALHHGAREVIVVGEVAEALIVRQRDGKALLAGERGGQRILAAQAGGADFDLGNSPREFTPEIVADRTIVMTTTNGTRALRGCATADHLFAGSFLNLNATAQRLTTLSPKRVVLVCAGTADEASYEDTIAAGALCSLLPASWFGSVSDGCLMARELYAAAAANLESAFALSRNGRRLSADPKLRDDVGYCAQVDRFEHAVRVQSGVATLDR